MRIKVKIEMIGENAPAAYTTEVNEALCVIGRQKANLPLTDLRCSKQHALLYQAISGDLHIRDAGSTNGTLVNGKRIADDVLKVNDKIRIGRTIITLLEYESTAIPNRPRSMPANSHSNTNTATVNPPTIEIPAQEPDTVTSSVMLLNGPQKFFSTVPKDQKGQFIDYVDKQGTCSRIEVSKLPKKTMVPPPAKKKAG